MSTGAASATSSKSIAGPLLIGLSGAIWATDALFRVPTVKVVDPTFIVLFEHVIGVVLLGIWALLRHRDQMRGFSVLTWFWLFLIGAGGSAVATVLFTSSFADPLTNPSVPILLQKLQSVMVVVLAFIFLRETPSKGFWGWALVALIAALVMSFPKFNFGFLSEGINWHSHGVIYALTAAGLWALSTVAGKAALNHVPPAVVTFWRYFFGMITLAVLFVVSGQSFPIHELQDPTISHALLYMALMPGILALVCYYNGLSRTSATTATFVELLYPIGAVTLNWTILHQPLVPVQMLAGVILLYAVARISANA